MKNVLRKKEIKHRIIFLKALKKQKPWNDLTKEMPRPLQ